MKSVDDGNLKWRYQLINYGTDDQPDLELHEVYFDVSTGKVEGWTEHPYQISGYENIQDIVGDLKLILKTIDEDIVVNIKDLEK